MCWWINLTNDTTGPHLWEFDTEDDAARYAAQYVAAGWTLVAPPARREDTSLRPEGLQALANLIRLEEDRGTGALAPGVYEAAQAEALRFGYSEPEMEIVSDWFTGFNSTWLETLDFLDDPFNVEWLARMVLAGWATYDVNHQPITKDALRRVMTAWPPHHQDECWAWIRAQEVTDQRFESAEHALGEWIRRDVDSDDEPHGERVIFVDRGHLNGDPSVDIVAIDGTPLQQGIPLRVATAEFGDCRISST